MHTITDNCFNLCLIFHRNVSFTSQKDQAGRISFKKRSEKIVDRAVVFGFRQIIKPQLIARVVG